MASVTLDEVTKTYDTNTVVNRVSMEIEHGEFLVLVGPSGCGKSTTLRMLAGLETITSGRVLIGDRVVNNLPARDRDIAMVFQSYALYPHMSVFDNMAFGLQIRKQPKDEIARRVREVSASLGLDPLLDRKPRQLSGGQRQRVALGRAIVRDPAVFLLDEPLSNLDAKLRVQTRAELSLLHERLGSTFVYVTHDQVEAMTMATRIAVLDHGLLQQIGTPRELYETPSNIFVAGFIGSPAMNLLDGTVTRDGEAVRLNVAGLSLPIPDALMPALDAAASAPLTIGIRPEHVYDSRFPAADTSGTEVSARVDLTELMGNEVFLHLVINDVQVLARVDPRTDAKHGDLLPVTIDHKRLHIFNTETGDRLA